MNYTNSLNNLSKSFIDKIEKVSSTQVIPTENFGWENYRYQSNIFRLAHVERYTDDKVDVLHVTTFPPNWCPNPIFGFDVIATRKEVIGCYMDFSPVLYEMDFTDGITFEERKPTPDWATIFSKYFIALKPKSDEEFIKFTDWVLTKYDEYIKLLEIGSVGDIQQICEKQNIYCEVQASNPRTYNVLKHKIGEEKAKYFMENILFPKTVS